MLAYLCNHQQHITINQHSSAGAVTAVPQIWLNSRPLCSTQMFVSVSVSYLLYCIGIVPYCCVHVTVTWCCCRVSVCLSVSGSSCHLTESQLETVIVCHDVLCCRSTLHTPDSMEHQQNNVTTNITLILLLCIVMTLILIGTKVFCS